MALVQCNFFSEVLGLSTAMTVILPQQTTSQIGLRNNQFGTMHPTLYLLHGMSDDHSIWLRRTSIERYVAPLGLAVVMPQVDLSFYTDMAYGNKYWTFISEELPHIAQSFFHLSSAREDNFVAGLSMGGYGAMKLALRKPDMFAAAASLSGALDVGNSGFRERLGVHADLAFGDQPIAGTDNDLIYLLKQCARTEDPKPQLYTCCGTEDFLYEDNLVFKAAVEQTGLEFTYEEGPGVHDWAYWDEKIQDVLNWLPLGNRTR